MKLLFVISLYSFVFVSCSAVGVWGTGSGTRKKRAAERDFTLPPDAPTRPTSRPSSSSNSRPSSRLSSSSRPNSRSRSRSASPHIGSGSGSGSGPGGAKSFEELQAEAEAEAEVEAEVEVPLYADQVLNSLHSSSSSSSSFSSSSRRDLKKNKKIGSDDASGSGSGSGSERVSVEEVENFLSAGLDKLEDLWSSQSFESDVKKFLVQVLEQYYTGAEADSIRELMSETRIHESLMAAKGSIEVLRSLIPTVAQSLLSELSNEDVHTLMNLDFSITDDKVSPEMLSFFQRIMSKAGSAQDGSSPAAGLDELMNMFSSLQGKEGGKEANANVDELLAMLKEGGECYTIEYLFLL
jgi:hypothetical protein